MFINIPGITWRDPVSIDTDLPSSGNTIGDARVVGGTTLYLWDGTAWNIAMSSDAKLGEISAADTPGTIVSKMEVFDATGTSLGFIPIYNEID